MKRDPIKCVPKKYRPAGELTRCQFGHEYVSGRGCPTCRNESIRKAQMKLHSKRPPVSYEYVRATPIALDHDQLAAERAAFKARRKKQFDRIAKNARERRAAGLEPSEFSLIAPRSRILTRDCVECGHEFDQLRGHGRPSARCPRCIRAGRAA